jgi:hypothetical protein
MKFESRSQKAKDDQLASKNARLFEIYRMAGEVAGYRISSYRVLQHNAGFIAHCLEDRVLSTGFSLDNRTHRGDFRRAVAVSGQKISIPLTGHLLPYFRSCPIDASDRHEH